MVKTREIQGDGDVTPISPSSIANICASTTRIFCSKFCLEWQGRSEVWKKVEMCKTKCSNWASVIRQEELRYSFGNMDFVQWSKKIY